jgi:hypothetical protein
MENDRAIYDSGIGDFRARYEDGAFVAFPDPNQPVEEEETIDPQIPYYNGILRRHETLRGQLQHTPPSEAIERLRKDQPTYVQKLSRDVARHWSYMMMNADPTSTQIACMDKDSILRLLRLLEKDKILKRGMNINPNVSRWTWSLLAKLPERGELTSEEIGIVRDLGKKAILVGTGLREESNWEAGMQELEAGLEGSPGTQEIPVANGDSDVDEDVFDIINEDEIPLDPEDEIDVDLFSNGGAKDGSKPEIQQQVHPTSELPVATTINTITPARAEQSQLEDQPDNGGKKVEVEDIPTDDQDLAVVKARLLQRLTSQHLEFSVNLEPEIIVEPAIDAVQKPVMDPEALKWNTKATVDMIITVAGEIYGQRDLLEFRSLWNRIM